MIKLLGAILIIGGCGGFGFHIAATYRKEVRTMQQLLSAISLMECELHYRLTPLPALVKIVTDNTGGVLKDVFHKFSNELERQVLPNVALCMQAALQNRTDLPPLSSSCLILLGNSLGQFDTEGQLNNLTSLHKECSQKLNRYMHDKDPRLKSYQTLSLCAGAALAILFI